MRTNPIIYIYIYIYICMYIRIWTTKQIWNKYSNHINEITSIFSQTVKLSWYANHAIDQSVAIIVSNSVYIWRIHVKHNPTYGDSGVKSIIYGTTKCESPIIKHPYRNGLIQHIGALIKWLMFAVDIFKCIPVNTEQRVLIWISSNDVPGIQLPIRQHRFK